MAPVTVRGEGGAVFDMDVPAEGTVHRELFDDAVAKGRLTVVEDPDGLLSDGDPDAAGGGAEGTPPAPAPEPAEELTEPPRSGRGSGLDAWVSFAAASTDAPESAYAALSRDEIIALLESEGVIEPEEA